MPTRDGGLRIVSGGRRGSIGENLRDYFDRVHHQPPNRGHSASTTSDDPCTTW